jgi:hypothetical protein
MPIVDVGDAIEMNDELQYFIHTVDGSRYGAWYRVISSDRLEVIGVGMLETGEFAGYAPESSARSMLENFVREQKSLGISLPTLDADAEDRDEDESTLPSAADATVQHAHFS